MLLHGGHIDSTQLEQGLSSQVAHGARLGTNLVELGHVGIDLLAKALADQHSVPVAAPEAFEAANRETRAVVPAPICSLHGVFPLRYESPSRLHLAMIDPGRLDLIDEVGAVLSILEIHPYAAPELRMHYQLERHFQIRRPARFLRAPDAAIATAQKQGPDVPAPPGDPDRRHYLMPTAAQHEPEAPVAAGPASAGPGADGVNREPHEGSASDALVLSDRPIGDHRQVDSGAPPPRQPPAAANSAATMSQQPQIPTPRRSQSMVIPAPEQSAPNVPAPDTVLAQLQRARDRETVVQTLAQPLLPQTL